MASARPPGTGEHPHAGSAHAVCSYRVAMHAILFGIKRSFHTSVALLRDFLSDFQLTPARYDLLFVVHEHDLRWMSDVRRMLGVTAATISRMLKSLVDRGMVRVTRPPTDRRQREITLTALGEECLRSAMELLRRSSAIDFWVETMFELPGIDPFERMKEFYASLAKVREACGDTSTDPDRWSPGEYDDAGVYEGFDIMDDVDPGDLGPEELPVS